VEVTKKMKRANLLNYSRKRFKIPFPASCHSIEREKIGRQRKDFGGQFNKTFCEFYNLNE